MMKLGMINNRPTKESLAYVKSLGLSFIEMCNNNNEESIDCTEKMAQYVADAKEAGLYIGSLGRWNAEMNKGGKVDEKEFAIVAQNLDDAIACGSPTFVCGCNYDDSVSLYKNYNAAIEIFGRMLEKAKGTGTNIAVYNCDWNNFINNMEAWKIVLGELPELMIKFDASHSYNADRNYMREISDWGDRFAHVHIKGTLHANGLRVDDPPAGMDDINWRSLFAALYARKYDGGLSIEPHSVTWRGELGEKGVKFTIDFIKQFIL